MHMCTQYNRWSETTTNCVLLTVHMRADHKQVAVSAPKQCVIISDIASELHIVC